MTYIVCYFLAPPPLIFLFDFCALIRVKTVKLLYFENKTIKKVFFSQRFARNCAKISTEF